MDRFDRFSRPERVCPIIIILLHPLLTFHGIVLGGHNAPVPTDVPNEDGTYADVPPPSAVDTPLRRAQTALEALKYQHAALAQTMSALTFMDQGPSLRASPMLATAREEEEIQARTPSTGFSTIGRASHRMSTQSDGSIWFDAQEYDGAEEFLLDEAPEDGLPSKTSTNGSVGIDLETPSSGTSADLESSSDSDSESELYEEPPERKASTSTDITAPSETAVVRRTLLPSLPVGDEGSLFAVLKKNVGKVRTVHTWCQAVQYVDQHILGFGSSGVTGLIQRAVDIAAKGSRRVGVL